MDNEKKETIIGLLIGILIALMVAFMLYSFVLFPLNQEIEAKENACIKLGFKDYEYKNFQDYCEDSDYNLHYIKMISVSNDYFNPKYVAKKITVGEVEVKR